MGKLFLKYASYLDDICPPAVGNNHDKLEKDKGKTMIEIIENYLKSIFC